MAKKLLEGKNAIVTGSARGIGHKTVEVFAAHGANVWACARTQTSEFDAYCTVLSSKYGVNVKPLYFELTDTDQVKAAVKVNMADKRPVDVLMNNAGITYNSLFQMTNREWIDKSFDVNFISPYIFTQYIVKLMARNGKGSIINIASTAAIDGNSGRSVYGATKAAVICMTKAIAEELGEKGIRANSIAPGITETDMLGNMSEGVINESVNSSDSKQIGHPEDIANAALFFASDLSSYVTGQVLRVDGGL
jgi:3-oxoacyl-[acyl-carrier protein] reductase